MPFDDMILFDQPEALAAILEVMGFETEIKPVNLGGFKCKQVTWRTPDDDLTRLLERAAILAVKMDRIAVHEHLRKAVEANTASER